MFQIFFPIKTQILYIERRLFQSSNFNWLYYSKGLKKFKLRTSFQPNFIHIFHGPEKGTNLSKECFSTLTCGYSQVIITLFPLKDAEQVVFKQEYP
jgi:hypothetical protein